MKSPKSDVIYPNTFVFNSLHWLSFMGTRRECKNLIQGEGYQTPPPMSGLRSGKVYMTYAPKPNQRPGVVKIDPDEELENQMDSISDVVTRVARNSSRLESSQTEASF